MISTNFQESLAGQMPGVPMGLLEDSDDCQSEPHENSREQEHGFSQRNLEPANQMASVEVQQQWLDDLDRTIENLPKDGVLLHADGCFPRLSGVAGGAIFEKESDPDYWEASRGLGLHLLIALNSDIGKLTRIQDDSITSDSLIRLLEKIKSDYSDASIVKVVLDNTPYTRSKKIENWTANQSGKGPTVELIYVPPFCSHFNRVERVMKLFRDDRLSKLGQK